MPFIVYETTNLINGKKYRGVHEQDGEEFDGYFGSSKSLNSAVGKYGRDNFERRTLFSFESEKDAYSREAEIVTEEWCKRKDTYNVKPGGIGGFPWRDPERLAAHSARMKAARADPDWRAEHSARRKAACADPDWRAANSARRKAACADPDWRAAHPVRCKAGWVRRRLRKANTMLVIID